MSAPPKPPGAPSAESVGGVRPDYLRRRAPARVEVTDASGRPLRMTRRFVHVRAGQQIRVRVVPQAPSSGAEQPKVKLRTSDSLYAVVDEHTVPGGAVLATLAQYQVRQRGNVPIPKRAALNVSVEEPGHEAFLLVVPLVVWPSWWFLLSLGFLTAAGPLVGHRFYELAKAMNPFEAVREMVTNSTFVTSTVGFAVLAALGLKMAGWAAVWAGWVAGDAE